MIAFAQEGGGADLARDAGVGETDMLGPDGEQDMIAVLDARRRLARGKVSVPRIPAFTVAPASAIARTVAWKKLISPMKSATSRQLGHS